MKNSAKQIIFLRFLSIFRFQNIQFQKFQSHHTFYASFSRFHFYSRLSASSMHGFIDMLTKFESIASDCRRIDSDFVKLQRSTFCSAFFALILRSQLNRFNWLKKGKSDVRQCATEKGISNKVKGESTSVYFGPLY